MHSDTIYHRHRQPAVSLAQHRECAFPQHPNRFRSSVFPAAVARYFRAFARRWQTSRSRARSKTLELELENFIRIHASRETDHARPRGAALAITARLIDDDRYRGRASSIETSSTGF